MLLVYNDLAWCTEILQRYLKCGVHRHVYKSITPRPSSMFEFWVGTILIVLFLTTSSSYQYLVKIIAEARSAGKNHHHRPIMKEWDC